MRYLNTDYPSKSQEQFIKLSPKALSKFLSLVLRHHPETVGITLDESGWANVEELLSGLAKNGKQVSRSQLQEIVASNSKQRFAFSQDGQSIRANQGHSVEINLKHPQAQPPEILLHGTPEKFVEAIKKEGLKKLKRHDVHLHEDLAIATEVGKRRGRAVVLNILSGKMHRDGIEFFRTPNNVWLVDSVPPKYIQFPEE